MNIDTGELRAWNSLTPEEQSSGRWIRFDGDRARLKTELDEMFTKSDAEWVSKLAAFTGKHFDATGKVR